MVLLDLIHRAHHLTSLPIPVLHVDTGHNYPEVMQFIEQVKQRYDLTLITASVDETISKGLLKDNSKGRNALQTPVLLSAINQYGFKYVFGGARRDEDRARAKERLFSLRTSSGGWLPEAQGLELWETNTLTPKEGENLRVFPLSHWTELDVWRYIELMKIPLPSLYYAHEREVFNQGELLVPVNPLLLPTTDQTVRLEQVRFRTVGDMFCTAVVPSTASNATEVISELLQERYSERGKTRLDDKLTQGAMEIRKREGYF